MKRLANLPYWAEMTILVLAIMVLVSWTAPKIYNLFKPIDWDKPVAVAHKLDKPRPKSHQVMPGDSLWSIAAENYPGRHTGEMVLEIRKLNGLTSTVIHPYTTVLKLPEVE